MIGSLAAAADIFRLLGVLLEDCAPAAEHAGVGHCLTNKAAGADDFRRHVQKHQDSL